MAGQTLRARPGAVNVIETWSVERVPARVVLALLLAVMTAFSLLSLLRTPAPFIDEVWFANRAWAFLQTGKNFGTLDHGVWDNYEGYWTYFPWLPTVFEALSFQLFGLSLFSLRLTSVAFGLVLLVSIYAIADQVGGRRLALLAVVMVALSRAFIYSSHLGRPDIMGAAFGFAAIALYMTDRSPRLSVASVASGLALGFAFESHPFGVIYVPVIGAMYILDHGRSFLKVRRFWGFVLGVGGGLAFYAALHILPYPHTYFEINRIAAMASGAVRTPPLITPDLAVWAQSVADMATQFISLWNVRIPLILGAVAILCWRRSPADRRLLNLCTLLLLAYLVLIRNKNPWYAIMVAPAGDLLAALFLTWLSTLTWSEVVRARVRIAPTLWYSLRGPIVAILILATAAPTLIRAFDRPMDDYQTTLDQIRQVVPPGQSVIGPATYWFATTDEQYFSWEQLVYYRRYAPGSSVGDALRALHPSYFVIDPYIEKFFRDTPRTSVNAQQLLLPKAELDAFLRDHAELATVIETATYGQVRVYRLAWD